MTRNLVMKNRAEKKIQWLANSKKLKGSTLIQTISKFNWTSTDDMSNIIRKTRSNVAVIISTI